MLTLYMRPSCTYCIRVLEAAGKEGILFDLRNIANPAHAAELMRRGGKRQVPYLVDEMRGIEMYESVDIIRHLAGISTAREVVL